MITVPSHSPGAESAVFWGHSRGLRALAFNPPGRWNNRFEVFRVIRWEVAETSGVLDAKVISAAEARRHFPSGERRPNPSVKD